MVLKYRLLPDLKKSVARRLGNPQRATDFIDTDAHLLAHFSSHLHFWIILRDFRPSALYSSCPCCRQACLSAFLDQTVLKLIQRGTKSYEIHINRQDVITAVTLLSILIMIMYFIIFK